ncbi:MAG: DNA polymerase III subunit delta' [Rhodocyclaceae bacterium]|nr:DNA polymerase III subunit delta' [Rhodocyclaceae bacterium]
MNIIDLYADVWRNLQGQRQRLPHALLLVGQRGLGKFDFAMAFAAGLLCEQQTRDGQACSQCLACNWFSQGNHPDFRLLQPGAMSEEGDTEESKKKASQQITVDQIRELDEFFNVGTHRAGLRIVLINPTETMNRNAANSLLKTLEEPSANTLFLLVSSEPLKLLPTIRSRCQVVPISLPKSRPAKAFLVAAGVKDEARWLALAGGSPGLAIELANSGQGGWLDVLVKRLSDRLGPDPIASAADLEKLVKDSKGKLPLKAVVEALQKWLVDLTLASNNLPVRYFLPQQSTISGLAAIIPSARLLPAYRALLQRRREAEQPLNARLFFEGLFMDYRALFKN